ITRRDLIQSINETFEYDDLSRLTRVTRNGTPTLGLAYELNGNVQSKSDADNYTYDPVRFNAVTAISGSPGRRYQYDANGNMTDRNGAELLWFVDNRLK